MSNIVKLKIKKIRNIVKRDINKVLINFLPRKVYYSLPSNFKDFGMIIEKYSKKIDNFFFVQIGSNDGFSGDPIVNQIIKNKWKGILVEPVKYLFQKLKTNYKNKDMKLFEKLVFENVAISNKNQYRNLYRLKRGLKGMPRWYEQVGSFDKNEVIKNLKFVQNIEEKIVVEKVKCLTLNKLLIKNKVKKIDLLHIDTEGFDYEIIKMIDFKKIKPKIIFYEHMNLGQKDIQDCKNMLIKEGYFLFEDKSDTLAISNSIL